MQDRFNEWNIIKKYKVTDINFYDVVESKCIYSMTGNSLLNINEHPFPSCVCRRGMACNNKHVCTLLCDAV